MHPDRELRLPHLKFKGKKIVDGLLKAEILPNYFLSSQIENCSFMSVQENELTLKNFFFPLQLEFFSL